MPLIVDKINKILFVTSHKCGISTISTFVLNIYENNKHKSTYAMGQLAKLGCTKYNKEYDSYYKILVLRNPYNRFISSILQDSIYRYSNDEIDLTFYDFCRFLHQIYDKPNINYFINSENIKKPLSINLTHNKCKNIVSKNLLNAHLEPQTQQIHNEINFINNFDKVIELGDLENTLKFIKNKYNLNVTIYHANEKPKSTDTNIDIVNTKIKDFKNIKNFPLYSKFYNNEIKHICEEIYSEDFDLCSKYGININNI